MKCTSKKICLFLYIAALMGVTGCGSQAYSLPYSPDSSISSYRMLDIRDEVPSAKPFAADLCVVSGDVSPAGLQLESASGALFDLKGGNTIYAKNVHAQLAPASLTKILTALTAIKRGSLDTVITVSGNVKIAESGAQVCGLKQGDQLTLSQALHLMLINSANDAAIAVAEGVAGSVEAFAEMMNEEARAIGATNTNFVNPHGLSAENHYTTAYDMYLILNEAVKHEAFNQIILMPQYTTSCVTASGTSREFSVKSTNLYLQGEKQAPERVTVLGGKTGTTNAAGHCLALVSQNTTGHPFISIIMRSDSRDRLYEQMTDLLGEIK